MASKNGSTENYGIRRFKAEDKAPRLRDLLPRRTARMIDPNSVGLVDRQYAHFEETLHLRSGGKLEGFTLAYETYGKLNTERSNVIWICHALSGDSHVAGYYTDDPEEKPGWWNDAVGPGKMYDTNRYFVICANVLGGCRGSTGPSSSAPDGKPFGLRFPIITIADMVEAQRYLAQHLGIKKIFALVGGSMGGMQALQWAVDAPEEVENVLFIASTPRSSTQNIAFNEIGRQAIYADPNWRDGDYYTQKQYPDAGLAVARMIGHITYMSETSLEGKFGRQLQDREELAYSFETDFTVESYLQYQGFKFTRRFDANSYLYITKALDYYDVAAGHSSIDDALQQITAEFLVVSFSSDWLYTATQARELVEPLQQLGRAVDYHHVQASFGHDSFLVEVETMTQLVGGYLDKRWAGRGKSASNGAKLPNGVISSQNGAKKE
jgi:homoserine O-acetyltransferase/O-succinyltransferase